MLKNKVDLASVYRTLGLLEELGLVFVDEVKGKKYYYVSRRPHHHIICRKCGKVVCLPCQHKFKVKNFFNITHSLKLSGLCNNCYKN